MDREELLLQVSNLTVNFRQRQEVIKAVDGISFDLKHAESLAIVGESGSGKSVSAMSLMRLLPPPPLCDVQGKIVYKQQDITDLPERSLRKLRGKEIAYIFQEPANSLNPVFTIGYQIAEAIHTHYPEDTHVKEQVIDLLNQVGITEPHMRYGSYPHELSGGMLQRVMIAMALACKPSILIADEPTTALDVTIQKQILDLILSLQQKIGMALIIITHNFGVVKYMTSRVIVMRQGQIVEEGKTAQILKNPQHPYTRALIQCIPKIGQQQDRLITIEDYLCTS